MIRKISLIIIFLIFSNICYSSFPVVAQTTVECSDNIYIKDSIFNNETPIFGILSIIFAVISAYLMLNGMFNVWVLSLVFTSLAVIFGYLGIGNKLHGLAATGLFLGILELIIIGLIYSLISLALMATNNY